MKNIFIIVFSLLLALHANAQDTITTTKGEEIYVKVLEVSSPLIKYKLPDTSNTEVHTIETASVFMIKYKNGSKDVFSIDTSFIAENYKYEQNCIAMAEHGKSDALLYYHGSSGCVVGTVFITLFGGFLGLVPACACSLIPPTEYKLNYPDEKLMRDQVYSRAYRDQAFLIKKKKTWRAFGYTAGAEAAVSLILIGIIVSIFH